MKLLSSHLVHSRGSRMAALIGIAIGLQVAAAVGLSYVAGFGALHRALGQFRWPWIFACIGALVVSFAGYYYAYDGIYRVEHGPRWRLSARELRSIVAAGFGGFLAQGGSALDRYALDAAGTDERDATVRVTCLAGLEHGVLGLFGCAAGISVLLAGYARPPSDFSIPWAVIPIPGFLVAFWLAERLRDRYRHRGGVAGRVGIFLDAVHLCRLMFRHPIRRGPALVGMAVFWATDLFAAWAGLATFGIHMNGAQFIIGFATGLIFTRRTGPLGGAGVLELVLPVTLWYSGTLLAPAIAGIFVYRFLALWIPLPFSLASLPTLRQMGEENEPGTTPPDENEPALEPRAS